MAFRNVLGRFKRLVLITLGLICLVLGIIGYVLPGLPGTIWLILAATFFVRSSDVLYRLVINNRLFGQQVKQFLETGAIPSRAKTMSLASMWIFSLASIFFAPYGWLFDIPILLLAVIGTIYIISRPTLGERPDVPCRETQDEQRREHVESE
jgi:hypothetical protein